MYRVKEMFYTLQGEGSHAGRPAVFVRFTGCNLWSGREEQRATAVCQFCDTDFTPRGSTLFKSARELAEQVAALLPETAWNIRTPMVVLTGGEPLLQVDKELISELLAQNLYTAIETNGTQAVPFFVDWLCVSPKANTTLKVSYCDEVKLVYPQHKVDPEEVRSKINAQSYRLQPMDGDDLKENTQAAVDYCLKHPLWRLSLQTHKLIGLK